MAHGIMGHASYPPPPGQLGFIDEDKEGFLLGTACAIIDDYYSF